MNNDVVTPCVFCDRIERRDYVHEYGEAVLFAPLNPVVPGHMLAVPRRHAQSAAHDPEGAAAAMALAAHVVRDMTFQGDPPWDEPQANIITSIGEFATQNVQHTCLHVVPRAAGDGLTLPWTGQKNG